MILYLPCGNGSPPPLLDDKADVLFAPFVLVEVVVLEAPPAAEEFVVSDPLLNCGNDCTVNRSPASMKDDDDCADEENDDSGRHFAGAVSPTFSAI